jgi:hypothetical protein
MSASDALGRSGDLCEQIAIDDPRLPQVGYVACAEDGFVYQMDRYKQQLGECRKEVFDGVHCIDWSRDIGDIVGVIDNAKDYYLKLGGNVMSAKDHKVLSEYISEISYRSGEQADRYERSRDQIESSIQLLEHDVKNHEEPFNDNYDRIASSHNQAQRLREVKRVLELCEQEVVKDLERIARWFA